MAINCKAGTSRRQSRIEGAYTKVLPPGYWHETLSGKTGEWIRRRPGEVKLGHSSQAT